MQLLKSIAERLQPRTLECPRCGLNYPERDARCGYCADLSDAQVAALAKTLNRHRRTNRGMGKVYLLIAGLVALLLLIMEANR